MWYDAETGQDPASFRVLAQTLTRRRHMPRTFFRSTHGLQNPPAEIFYAPGVAGKTGPFYVEKRGILAAFRTSAWAHYLKWGSEQQVTERRRVWHGTVTWTEITDEIAPSVEELMTP
jgi:hypothetical protein